MSSFISIITAIHLAALSQIESGDNDRALGRFGEVTRYQMMPSELTGLVRRRRELRDVKFLLGWERDVVLARRLALALWQTRLLDFQCRYHRNPSLPELYLVWHRPGRPTEPTVVEFERAQRFANVVVELQKTKKS